MSKKYKDYTKPQAEPVMEEPVVTEVVEEPVMETETVKEPAKPTITKGTVVDCKKLNVRREPKRNAGVVTIIDAGADVAIDLKESTPAWYKVTTAAGVNGYCMKEFIAVV